MVPDRRCPGVSDVPSPRLRLTPYHRAAPTLLAFTELEMTTELLVVRAGSAVAVRHASTLRGCACPTPTLIQSSGRQPHHLRDPAAPPRPTGRAWLQLSLRCPHRWARFWRRASASGRAERCPSPAQSGCRLEAGPAGCPGVISLPRLSDAVRRAACAVRACHRHALGRSVTAVKQTTRVWPGGSARQRRSATVIGDAAGPRRPKVECDQRLLSRHLERVPAGRPEALPPAQLRLSPLALWLIGWFQLS